MQQCHSARLRLRPSARLTIRDRSAVQHFSPHGRAVINAEEFSHALETQMHIRDFGANRQATAQCRQRAQLSLRRALASAALPGFGERSSAGLWRAQLVATGFGERSSAGLSHDLAAGDWVGRIHCGSCGQWGPTRGGAPVGEATHAAVRLERRRLDLGQRVLQCVCERPSLPRCGNRAHRYRHCARSGCWFVSAWDERSHPRHNISTDALPCALARARWRGSFRAQGFP